MNPETAIQIGGALLKTPLYLISLVIVISVAVLFYLSWRGLSPEKCADFFLNVLRIIFRYKERTNERTDK